MSSTVVCRYWLAQGKCFYGNECKFKHTAGTEATPGQQSQHDVSSSSQVAAVASTVAATQSPAQSSIAPTSAPNKTSLAAHAGAKEWTPSGSAATFVPSSSPPPSSSLSSTVPSSSTTVTIAATPSSPAPAASRPVSKLNPNKTPFKPSWGGGADESSNTASGSTIAASAKPFYPSSTVSAASLAASSSSAVTSVPPSSSPTAPLSSTASSSTLTFNKQVAEFIPQSERQQSADHKTQVATSASASAASSGMHYGTEGEMDVEGQYGAVGYDETAAAGDDMAAGMPYTSPENVEDENDAMGMMGMGMGMGGMGEASSSFVPTSSYTTLDEFGMSSLPYGSQGGRPLPGAAGTAGSGISVAASMRALNAPRPASLFMDETLRQRLAQESHLGVVRLQPDDPTFGELPAQLDSDRYHSLLPLPTDPVPDGYDHESLYGRTHGGSVCYKVTSAVDGRTYVVKRLLGCYLSDDVARPLLQPWLEFQRQYGSGSAPLSVHASQSKPWNAGPAHPNVVALRSWFCTRDFGDAKSVLCLVYDYHPAAGALHPSEDGQSLPLEVIWNYIVQLATTIHALHENDMTAGSQMLLPGRVLVTGDHRVRLSCCGLSEVLSGKPLSPSELSTSQSRDLRNLGHLILGWIGKGSSQLHSASRSSSPRRCGELDKSLIEEEIRGKFPVDLVKLLEHCLLDAESTAESLLKHHLTPHLSSALTSSRVQEDYLENELRHELQNGRLFRLMVKLGFVTERPDDDWSSTGDRYMLSLFRDLVFHSQVGFDVPNINWGHVIHQLNKLDAGVEEKTLLSARNGDALMIVKYSDLKRCVDESYAELVRKAQVGLGVNTGGGSGGSMGMYAATAHGGSYGGARGR